MAAQQAPQPGGAVGEREPRVEDGPHVPEHDLEHDDAEVVGRLLHDFNTEFDDVTPGPTALAERVRELLAAGETTILLGSLGGSESHGLVAK